MNDVRTIAALIAERKGDRSYDRLSSDCGGAPSAARLQQLVTAPLRNFPDPPSINGMAAGLGTTVTDIVLACARSLGLDVYDDADPSALLLSGAADLPSSSRNLLVDLAGEFLSLTTGLKRDEGKSTQTSTSSDPEAGSSARIEASIEGLARDLNKTQTRALKSVTKAIVERPEHAEIETVAMTAWFMKKVTDLVDERAEQAAMYNDVRLMMPPNEDKAVDATPPNEGAGVDSQDRHELAARKGITQREWELNNEPQAEDEDQRDPNA